MSYHSQGESANAIIGTLLGRVQTPAPSPAPDPGPGLPHPPREPVCRLPARVCRLPAAPPHLWPRYLPPRALIPGHASTFFSDPRAASLCPPRELHPVARHVFASLRIMTAPMTARPLLLQRQRRRRHERRHVARRPNHCAAAPTHCPRRAPTTARGRPIHCPRRAPTTARGRPIHCPCRGQGPTSQPLRGALTRVYPHPHGSSSHRPQGEGLP